jgi:hypothetical protein
MKGNSTHFPRLVNIKIMRVFSGFASHCLTKANDILLAFGDDDFNDYQGVFF